MEVKCRKFHLSSTVAPAATAEAAIKPSYTWPPPTPFFTKFLRRPNIVSAFVPDDSFGDTKSYDHETCGSIHSSFPTDIFGAPGIVATSRPPFLTKRISRRFELNHYLAVLMCNLNR